MAENQAAAGNLAGLATPQFKPDDWEKRLAEQQASAAREMKFRCLDLACRTKGVNYDANKLTEMATAFHTFIMS